MKRFALLLTLAILLPFAASAQKAKAKKADAKPAVEAPAPAPAPTAAAWNVDGSHSYITFNVRHFFTPVPGGFDKFTGAVKFDPTNLATSSFDFTVDVASVNTKNEKRDGHLRSADFFQADSFKTMRFVSESIVSTGDNAFVAKGKLTVKNVTKDVEVPFVFLGQQDHPFREGMVLAGLKASFVVKRSDFGVGVNNWAQSTVVGEDVNVEVNLEVNRSK